MFSHLQEREIATLAAYWAESLKMRLAEHGQDIGEPFGVLDRSREIQEAVRRINELTRLMATITVLKAN
ncbi:MAG TPA: hypothetical protein VHE81_06630 [Lacipirellulaceae bacterium]|jgi:hypothetical protein|nr:hypothetical protein [Lacipirellulaceae bacterium]